MKKLLFLLVLCLGRGGSDDWNEKAHNINLELWKKQDELNHLNDKGLDLVGIKIKLLEQRIKRLEDKEGIPSIEIPEEEPCPKEPKMPLLSALISP